MQNKGNLYGLFLIFFIGILIYSHILHAPFQFDDQDFIIRDPALKQLKDIKAIWNINGPKLHFITLVTFAINYFCGGNNTFGYHLVNVILHIFTTMLLFYLLCIICQGTALRNTLISQQKRPFALFASLIFLTHPLQTQSVTYVWARSETLSAFFCLLSLLFYVLGRLKGKRWYYIPALLLFLIGLFTRGNIIILPLLVLLIEVVVFNLTFAKIRHSVARYWWFLIMVFGIAILGVMQSGRIFSAIQLPSFADPYVPRKLYLFTQCRVIVKYIVMSFMPVYQNVDYDFPLSQSFFELPILLSFTVLALILTTALLISRKHPFIAFGIAWFFICHLPTSSIFPLAVVISESRLYLPLVGFSIFLASLLITVIPNRSTKTTIAIVIILTFSSLTVARNFLWRSPISLFEDTVKKSPQHFRPHANLGTAYNRAGMYDKAIDYYLKAFSLTPKVKAKAQILINLGAVYGKVGNYHKAIDHYHQAIRLDRRNPQAYSNLGYAYSLVNDYGSAVQYGTKALEINPDFVEGINNLGVIYGAKGNYHKAVELFKRALELDPHNEKALTNMRLAQELLATK